MDLEAGIATAAQEVEVLAKADRRRFTAEYKLRILKEADACTKPGEIGALLRHEGLYSSHLSTWRVARDRGELAGLTPRKRGPKGKVRDGRDKRIAELERQIRRLKARAERAEALVEVQKKHTPFEFEVSLRRPEGNRVVNPACAVKRRVREFWVGSFGVRM